MYSKQEPVYLKDYTDTASEVVDKETFNSILPKNEEMAFVS